MMQPDFDTIIQRLRQRELWDFPGGIRPDERKELANTTAIQTPPIFARYHVALRQHLGAEANLLVEVGDNVLKGQPLTELGIGTAVPVHAPTSGRVTAIGDHASSHPSGIPVPTVTIEADGLDRWFDLHPLTDYRNQSNANIIKAIQRAGIAGLGGAGFPTHIKTQGDNELEFLIINGIECEPYIASDDRIMREHAWQIRQGIDILVHVLKPKKIIVAIEDNKPEAYETMAIACQEQEHTLVVKTPTKYPTGGERQLIQLLTGRQVPSGGLPIDCGVLMFNVGTCFAIADAIHDGKPVIERVVTLTGEALNQPQTTWARIGTPCVDLIQYAGYLRERQQQSTIIMGGPMMGFTLHSGQAPVNKTTNCLLVPASKELSGPENERACIRCSACADACPASLLPQQLFWYSKAQDYDKTEEYNLFDCIECGACAYVCPSEIPLVHYYRQAKAEIREQALIKEKAEKARERFDARKERLEREKAEREQKQRKAAEARQKAMADGGNDAKSKIAAALERAKAKKAALSTTAQQQKVEDTDAASMQMKPSDAAHNATERRDTASASLDNAGTDNAGTEHVETTSPTETLAKPIFEQPSEDLPTDDSEALAKKAKVTAALARAKAKRRVKSSS